VPFEEWRAWLEDPSRDPVWGAPFYSKTGVRPYFDQAGTIVPSLRRVWRKYPYFTNGSAGSTRAVLERFRWSETYSWHDATGEPEQHTLKRLRKEEIENLEDLLRFF
jgi:hypothetical protein